MTETWKPVPGWEGIYEVSDVGRIKSLARTVGSRWGTYRRPIRESVLAPKLNSNGYEQVSLNRDGAGTPRLVHRLVLAAFVGPCPEGMEGCHNDGDKRNNTLANLRWDTPSANSLDQVAHGTHSNTRKTHCAQGHPFTKQNTYVYADGRKRGCRTCRAAASARHKRKKEAA